MNVAFDASTILGRSGIERYSRELINGLLRTQADLTCTVAVNERDAAAVQKYFDHDRRVVVDDCLPNERRLGAPLRPLMRLVRQSRLSSAAQKAEVVHLLSPGKIIPSKRPILTTIHDLFPMYPDMGIDGYLARRFPGRVRRHLAASSAIVCPSAYVAGTIHEYFPKCRLPITVTPLAAGDEFVPTPMHEDIRKTYGLTRPYVLFVGRVDPRKNLHRMMYAWTTLPQSVRSNAQFVLMMAGGEQAVARFRQENSSVVSDPSIRIITDVPTRAMIQIMSSARALAFATLGEGFGLPVLEAMRCGCPVITSNTTSLPEVGGEAALYVDPTNVEQIADMMMRCIVDDDLVRQRREEGLAHSQKFTWDATARATADVYRHLIG
ncbi:MAG: glycosyltransferase family 4 protein [Bacteroidota bacterium]|jgi:alpha-1,3-rhamnosyl/mannosyltransferase